MRKLLFIFIIAVVSFGFKRSASPGLSQSTKIKAIYIYNFTKFVGWPASHTKGTFNIGVLGNNGMYEELQKMAATKKAGSQSLNIKKFQSVDKVTACHILYIPAESSSKLAQAVKKLAGKSTLIITEGPNLLQKGSAINFAVVNNRLVIQVNNENCKKSKLTVSEKLTKLSSN